MDPPGWLFPAWLSYGEALQVGGLVWIAVAIYRNGRRFGARRMRAVGAGNLLAARAAAAYQGLGRVWRRLRRTAEVRQLTATMAATSGMQARLTVTYPDDTAVTIELRRRIEDLEMERDRLSRALDAHDRRLEDARRAHDELAAGGVFVQAASVVLVVVGSTIAAASPGLAQIGWWGLLVVPIPLPLVWLSGPE